LKQIAQLMSKVMDSNLAVEFRPERTTNPVSRRLADTREAKRVIGFQTEVSLEAGLRQLVEWWRTCRPESSRSAAR
jgi:UDP-glucose 4-epimerase